MSGIYVIETNNSGGVGACVKIGKSISIAKRLKTYSTALGSKYSVYYLYLIPNNGNDIDIAEHQIHDYYNDYKIKDTSARELFLPGLLDGTMLNIRIPGTNRIYKPISINSPMEDMLWMLNIKKNSISETIFRNKETIYSKTKDTVSGYAEYRKEFFTTGLIKFWDKNRKIDNERVNKIVKEQKKYVKRYGEYYFCGSIILFTDGNSLTSENIRILDGQHRLSAIKKLLKDESGPKSVEIETIVYFNLNTEEKASNVFRIANMNTEVVGDFLLSDRFVQKSVNDIISELFDQIIPKSSRGKRRPNVDIEILKDIIAGNKKVVDLASRNTKQLKKEITKFDSKLKHQTTIKKAKKFTNVNFTPFIYGRCVSKGCLYGLYKNFEWFTKILNDKFDILV